MFTLNEFIEEHLHSKGLRTVVIYRSYLGASRHYAEWLADRLDADVFTMKHWEHDGNIANYDRVVVVSGTYGGHMPLVAFLRKHWEELSTKPVHVVAVGGDDPESPGSIAAYETIPAYIRAHVTYQKLPGHGSKEHVKLENIEPVLEVLAED